MILLGIHFYFNKNSDTFFGKLILIALFFSFLGDVFLMFRETGTNNQLLFLLGSPFSIPTNPSPSGSGLGMGKFWKFAAQV